MVCSRFVQVKDSIGVQSRNWRMFSTHTNIANVFYPHKCSLTFPPSLRHVLHPGSVTASCLSLKKEREILTEMIGTCYMDCKKSKVVLISPGDFL